MTIVQHTQNATIAVGGPGHLKRHLDRIQTRFSILFVIYLYFSCCPSMLTMGILPFSNDPCYRFHIRAGDTNSRLERNIVDIPHIQHIRQRFSAI